MTNSEHTPVDPKAEKIENASRIRRFIKTKTGKVVVGSAGLLGVAGIGAEVNSAINHGPSSDPIPTVSESWTPIPLPSEAAPTPSATVEYTDQINTYESMEISKFLALPWEERSTYSSYVLPLDEKQKSRDLWHEKSQNPKDIYPETVSVNSSAEDIMKISTDIYRQSITSHNIILDSSGVADFDKIQILDQDQAERIDSAGFYYTDDGWYLSSTEIIDRTYSDGKAGYGPGYYVIRNDLAVPDIRWESDLYSLPGNDGQELPARYIEAGWTNTETGVVTYFEKAYVWVDYPDGHPEKTADTPGTWLTYGHEVDRPSQ